MRYLVCIKHVPDTEGKVSAHSDGKQLDSSAVTKWTASPYDDYALEQALLFRDAAGEGEVVAVCAGPEACSATLRQALAAGADRALLLLDETIDRADALTRARALAALVEREQPQMVLVGKYGAGTDEGTTGPMLAELLDWPHVAGISAITLEGDTFRASRAVEGALEVHEGSLPALFCCDKGLNSPRYPSLKGIMLAKKKPIDRLTPADLGLAERAADSNRQSWEAFSLPPSREAGRLIGGDPATAAKELVRILHEEAKVL